MFPKIAALHFSQNTWKIANSTGYCLVKEIHLLVFFIDFDHNSRTTTLQNSFLQNTFHCRTSIDDCFCSSNEEGKKKTGESNIFCGNKSNATRQQK